MKKTLFLIIITLFLIACANAPMEVKTNEKVEVVQEIEVELPEWMKMEFEDVRTGEKYRLEDFSRPVLLESFAVWCPTCTRQQNVIKDLHEEIGEQAISIALDTDPNESKDLVIDHIEKNGFDWIYSISPSDMTQSLIDEFGLSIVNAPTVPMLLICPDGSYEKLKSGVKNVEYFTEKITGCLNALS